MHVLSSTSSMYPELQVHFVLPPVNSIQPWLHLAFAHTPVEPDVAKK